MRYSALENQVPRASASFPLFREMTQSLAAPFGQICRMEFELRCKTVWVLRLFDDYTVEVLRRNNNLPTKMLIVFNPTYEQAYFESSSQMSIIHQFHPMQNRRPVPYSWTFPLPRED